MDPAVATSLRCALALLLASTALHKLRDLPAFRAAVAGYALVPAPLVGVAAGCFVAAELVLALALLAPGEVGRAAALAAGALLALYTAAIAVNLGRGRRDVDCGCAGPGARQTLHGGLVARNLALAAAALAAGAPVAARTLHAVDAVTIGGAVLAASALYAASQHLLALAPRLASPVAPPLAPRSEGA